MKNLIHVCSSNADIYCDENGFVREMIDLGGIEEVKNISQFNFTECDAYWGEKLEAYDILDLGGVYIDGTTFSPDYEWRKMIAKDKDSISSTLKYAKTKLDLCKQDMGTIVNVSIINVGIGKGISLEFSNGMTIRIHDNEIIYQAETYLESELEKVRHI